MILKTLGHHWLIELSHCNPSTLNSQAQIEKILLEAAQIAKVTVIKSVFHKFAPQGISGVVVIAESHLTIHTWPEHEYAAIDLFSCTDKIRFSEMLDFLSHTFEARSTQLQKITRGPQLH